MEPMSDKIIKFEYESMEKFLGFLAWPLSDIEDHLGEKITVNQRMKLVAWACNCINSKKYIGSHDGWQYKTFKKYFYPKKMKCRNRSKKKSV